MKREKTYVLILAGGIGSRFWPLSREAKPKQFLDILGSGKTLIQTAYERYIETVDPEKIFVITNEKYVDLIKEQLPGIDENCILAEPFGKNTAPCVAYAAHKIAGLEEDANMIVAPSDHLILNEENFRQQIHLALDFATAQNALITLGIKPRRPDTGFGYIQFQEKMVLPGIHRVKTFTEKPPLEMAIKFIESGDFLWNSGMFVWSVKSILQAFELHLPEMNLIFNEGKGAYNTKIEAEHINSIYARINAVSIDNGVLEKADNVFVLPSDFGWSDLGTWKSVCDNLEPAHENRLLNAKLEAIDSQNNLVVTKNEKLVVLKDIHDLFIIDTPDALLICKNDQDQEIKKIASNIKKEYRNKYS